MAKSTQECLNNSTIRIKEGISVASRSEVYQINKLSHYRKFSQIAECQNVRTGEILAIKFVKNKFYSQNKREVQILKQLKMLNLQDSNIVNFSECFSYQDRTCLVYEKLDSTFLELVLAANGTPVHLIEIRAIAYQMLVALTALNNSGFTHANIKPENIMTMDEDSHQYGVKLIGFSNSAKTSDLCDLKIPLDCGYTAPEVYLDCPLDESLDIWSLGCTLAFLFLGQHMSPVDCEYQYMRFIVDVLGQPENELLEKACQSRRFFKKVKQGSDYVWRLRTPKEFEKTTGSEVKKTDCNNFTDLSDFLSKSNQPEPIDNDDTEAFIDLLIKMLNVDPALRIKPADALNHPFITMTHLRYISDEFYLTESQRIMKECQHREQENTYSSLSTPNSNREQTPDLDFSKEGKINPSHSVQAEIRTGTSSIETKTEKKNTPHSDPRKISPNDEKFNQLFSSENFEGANSEDSKMDLSIKWKDEGSSSTDSQCIPSMLTPGMIITGNSKVYKVEEVLGSGTCGQVARCCIRGTEKVVALKTMSGLDFSSFYNDTKILERLNKLPQYNNHFIRLNDSFCFQDFLYQEFELLDRDLWDFMEKGGYLKVAEVRAIAQQTLEALSALKQLGITHTDLKLDNIMLVNHEAQPFRVKLIDFGSACETERLLRKSIYQLLLYRAPEITLGLPRDEAMDTWSLGCVLSVLFLHRFPFPHENEYDNLRIIIKLLGQPDQKLLDEGTLVSDYFRKGKNGSECSWRFKTLKQYEKKRGAVSTRADAAFDDLTTLDDMFFSENTQNSTENEDIKAFLDLVKKMLTVDPANRILPADALKHPFITMEHLDGSSGKRYVRNARKLMRNVQPGKFPSDGESVISERPGPSQVPGVQTDLDRSLPKTECDKSAFSTKFSSKEIVEGYLTECKRGNIAEKTSIDTREKNESLHVLKNEEAMCSKKLLELTSTVNTEELHMGNLSPNQSTDWETSSSDTHETNSSDSESSSSKLIPGMMITGDSKDYIVEEVLGSGSYGAVARCRIRGTEKVVALKTMSGLDSSSFYNETKILERLNKLPQYNNHFIRLNDSFCFQDFLYQEFELLDKDLWDFVKKDVSLKVAEVRVIAQQTLEALSALKQLGITHTDLKLDNIMLVNHEAQPFRVKLIDFGLAVETERLLRKSIYQTLPYRAPEITLGLPRDEAIDTWSLGCLLSVLFLHCLPFPHENEYDNLRIILKFLGQPDQKLLDEGILVSDYFRKGKNGSECSWRFKTLKQYEKKRGAVSTRADEAYDELTTLDDMFFSQNTQNSSENEDIKAFLDLVKKMLTVDPANRILPADALKHPFITMEHLDGSSDKSYVRNARKLMRNVQPGKFPSDGESVISERPGPSQVPGVQTDLDRSLPKAECDKSAFSTKFSSKEIVEGYLTECKRGNVTEKTSIDTREKNESLHVLKNEEAMCSKKSLEKTSTVNTEELHMGNLSPDRSTDWETSSSDTDETNSSDSESSSSKLIPGMMITGDSKDYIVEEVLGSGSYGAVARCRIWGTEKVVALKKSSGLDSSSFYNETKILERLNKLPQCDNHFIRLNDSFCSQDVLYQEFELLDKDLWDFTEKGGPLKVAEVRVIAQQTLVALNTLKHLGITHTDLKLENIMLVNHEAQPFRVKLIDFGLAVETERLLQKGIFQTLPYRAPEITLGLPRDEAITTWSLGCLLSVLFLHYFPFPHENEYDNLRIIIKLLGQPDQKLLDEGTLVSDYFRKGKNGSECSWRFKTLKQYEKKRGAVSTRADAAYDDYTTLDDMFFSENTQNSTENEDIKAFLDLVKKMLTVDPANRILPADALKHPFITMEHLDGSSGKCYVRNARKLMRNVQPGKFPSDGESVISERPGPNLSSKEIVKKSLEKQKGMKHTDAKRNTVLKKIKNFFTEKFHSINCYLSKFW
ncbi:uncharacterized protein [Nothobranchius furzeri]|uniref:uncharacterized protein n=1 Tax=Nothobranchius furzeri TaxID=105023 RepID=UPI003904B3B3